MIRVVKINKIIPITILVIGLFFSACGNNTNQSQSEEIEEQPFIGKLIDSIVQGVEYRCGETRGVTDSNGTFYCSTLPVSFYIGKIQLGTIATLPLDKQVFPQDIIDVNRSEVNNTQVVNLALLLQSLDNDHNASNGIIIEEHIASYFTQEVILENLSLEELKTTIKEQHEAIVFEEIDNVVEHLSFSVGIDSNSENSSSEDNSTLPIDENSNPENNATLPVNENNNTENNTTLPVDENSNPENNTTLPVDENSSPEDNATLPVDENSNPENNTTLPVDENSNPEDNATLPVDENSNPENNTTLPVDENSSPEDNATLPVDENSNPEEDDEDNNPLPTIDTTAPNPPTLTFTPTSTYANTLSVEVNGEVNSTLFINDITTTTIDSSGKVTVTLNTSGVDGIKTFSLILEDNSNNRSDALIIKINKQTETPVVIRPDTTPPLKPRLTTTPNITNQENLSIEVNGESGSRLLVNNIGIGTLSNGKLSLLLDTSGEDGVKDFNLTLKDSSNNYSEVLNLTIIKDATPPAQNATINTLTTDDTTPPLSGNLPSGEFDSNTSNYVSKIEIDNNHYDTTNNRDGTWSIANDIIDSLSMGYHDVNITVTDEANNSSSTFITNKIEVDNTGFFIDSAVEGIKYTSGAFSGYTDKDGLFKYDKGSGVTFYIGDESTGISLGTSHIKVDPYNSNRRIITLFDLAGTTNENNPKVVNMGKFLQSLDSDGDVSNGITIDERTKESIVLLNLKNHIDFNEDIEIFHNSSDIYNLMNDLAGHFGEHRGLIPTEDVKAHLVAVRDNQLATKNLSVAKVRGEKEAIKILDGVFKSINGVVEGLAYRSGNQFGRTDANGLFKYEEGKKVKFSIYQLELGITEAKAVVTPADLVPSTSFNHPKPRNIIRLLNAFDAPNSSNILIDDAVRESLEKYRSQIDINLPDGKLNSDAGISSSSVVDEFGAQFEDFEMGKEILDEIDRLRG